MSMDPESKTCSIVVTTFALLLCSVCVIFIFDIILSPQIESDAIECKLKNGIMGKCVISSACEQSAAEQTQQCGKLNDRVCCTKLNLLIAKQEQQISLKSFDGKTQIDKPLLIETVGKGVGEFKNHRRCGSANSDRIINGTEAVPAEFPYFAALIYRKVSLETGKRFTIGCGGSLISGF